MKDAADKRRKLEQQHAEALAQLRDHQAALHDASKATEKDRKGTVEVVEALQVSWFYTKLRTFLYPLPTLSQLSIIMCCGSMEYARIRLARNGYEALKSIVVKMHIP